MADRTSDRDSLHGRRALVTGGTKGTGSAVAARLREAGAQVWVHVVGGSRAPAGGFAALNEGIWQDELNLNLLGAVRLDRRLAPAMTAAGRGSIVHVSGSTARRPSESLIATRWRVNRDH
ncbi:SDR family NAD(P)-dependent oxidoreductase [Solwaraspora sp. WMMB335]|uniref:SDR family NAD(P)-dependent oxidoreductase n=1 Tax=Solwaraspora sp. WMMB335 TaxID=3404118 RepID=UPI003B930157